MLVPQKKPTQERKLEEIGKEEMMTVDLELGVKKEKFRNKLEPIKLLKEENQIVNLELAVKKEEYKIKSKKREFIIGV